jgi:hypothetical protein
MFLFACCNPTPRAFIFELNIPKENHPFPGIPFQIFSLIKIYATNWFRFRVCFCGCVRCLKIQQRQHLSPSSFSRIYTTVVSFYSLIRQQNSFASFHLSVPFNDALILSLLFRVLNRT